MPALLNVGPFVQPAFGTQVCPELRIGRTFVQGEDVAPEPQPAVGVGAAVQPCVVVQPWVGLAVVQPWVGFAVVQPWVGGAVVQP